MVYSFDEYVLDTGTRELRHGTELVPLEPQVFDLLVLLIDNRDRVVSKDDVMASVWQGRIVSESTLGSRINAARKAVGDSGDRQKLIRTIARKGFRFVGALSDEPAPEFCCADDAPDGRSLPAVPLPDRPSIAVLPFTNMSGDSEQEYFSDGISEDIITALSKLRWFFVIARNSSFTYKGQAGTPEADRRANSASATSSKAACARPATASASRRNSTMSRPAVTSGPSISTATSPTYSPFRTRSPRPIVAAIEPQLYAAENFRGAAQAAGQSRRLGSGDAGAVALLAGDAAGQPCRAGAAGTGDRHRPGLRSGARRAGHELHVRRAYGLGRHGDRGDGGRTRGAGRDQRRQRGCLGAPGPRPCLPDRRGGSTIRWPNSNWRLRLNPNFALAHGFLGLSLSYSGRWQEANEAACRAIRLSPRDPFVAIYCGIAAYAQFVGRNYAEAIALARDAIRQKTDFVGGHRVLTAAAAAAGETDVAALALRDLRSVQPNISLAWIAAHMPIRHDAEREHYLAAFRKAGLE